jgi:hypothetical protein
MSQFWCADTLLLSVTDGTVRLHARSHARGLKPSTCNEIDQCTAYGGYPGKHHGYTLHMSACSVYDPRHFPTPILEYAPRSGLAQAQPTDIYSLSLHKPIRAQHLLATIVANALFWSGFPSQSGLLHTTLTPIPLAAVLNSSFRPPAAYHHPVGTAPTRPRHNP